MMTFTKFTEKLAMGQLKNTAAVDDQNIDIPTIHPDFTNTLLSLTNTGLVDLSTKFPLVTQMMDLTFVTGQRLYPMMEAGLGTYLEVVDGVAFKEVDFIKILEVIDESGCRHATDAGGHIMSPSFNSLRFTDEKMEEFKALSTDGVGKVRIRYQVKYPTIIQTDSINLPPNLEIALQLFVASLYFSHMNGAEHTAKGDAYFATYLRHIGEDELKNNSSTSEVFEDTRLQDRGFV